MEIEICEKFFYRVEDDNENIYEKLNTCKENIIRNNDSLSIYKGEWIEVRVNNFIRHIVKPAQTINEIAKIYNIKVDEIVSYNNLKTEKLFIGQTLKINKTKKSTIH